MRGFDRALRSSRVCNRTGLAPRRCPAGEDDVDYHDGLGGRGVNEDVSRLMAWSFIGEFEGLVADADFVFLLKDAVWDWSCGIECGYPFEVQQCFHLSDVMCNNFVEDVGATNVIGVGVAGYEVRNWLTCNALDGGLKFLADRWGAVDCNNAGITE